MGRPCSVCRLPSAGAINELLATGRSASSVARTFGLSDDAVGRHRHHAPKQAPEPVPEPGGDPLDELVVALRARALAGNPSDTREYRLALLAQTAARQSSAPAHDLATTPEWIRVRTILLDALAPFPGARVAVADALVDAGLDG